jgi:pilus assembly protein Flp/PilA
MTSAGLKAFFADESGATGIEYALVGGIVSIGIVISLTSASTSLQAMFNQVAAAFH